MPNETKNESNFRRLTVKEQNKNWAQEVVHGPNIWTSCYLPKVSWRPVISIVVNKYLSGAILSKWRHFVWFICLGENLRCILRKGKSSIGMGQSRWNINVLGLHWTPRRANLEFSLSSFNFKNRQAYSFCVNYIVYYSSLASSIC